MRDEGRGLPEELDLRRQLDRAELRALLPARVECDDLRLLQAWVLHWRGTGASFEIVPVVESAQTREVVAPFLDKT